MTQNTMMDFAQALLGNPKETQQDHATALLEQATLARNLEEAKTPRLLNGFVLSTDTRITGAAYAALERWLATLPLERLTQPFYMTELQLAVAYTLATRGWKNTRLSPRTLAIALHRLGFKRCRNHGSSRPQNRFWLHPAANSKTKQAAQTAP